MDTNGTVAGGIGPKPRGPRYPSEEYARMARAAYDRYVRPHLTAADDGKFVAVDIETGMYEIDADDFTTTKRLYARREDAQPFVFRVGYRAAHTLGGTMRREDGR